MIGLLFFKPAYRGSALRIGSSVYFFAVGWTDDDSYPIHRIEMGAEGALQNVERIGFQPDWFYMPALFHASSDTCV